MIVPGSGLVKKQAEDEGLDAIFREAGFDWREAGCSMCRRMPTGCPRANVVPRHPTAILKAVGAVGAGHIWSARKWLLLCGDRKTHRRPRALGEQDAEICSA